MSIDGIAKLGSYDGVVTFKFSIHDGWHRKEKSEDLKSHYPKLSIGVEHNYYDSVYQQWKYHEDREKCEKLLLNRKQRNTNMPLWIIFSYEGHKEVTPGDLLELDAKQ